MPRGWFAAALLLAAGCRPSGVDRPAGLVDDVGTPVKLSATPRRVVSLIPATTELVFALGAGALLVGRTVWCDYPAEATDVPNLGNGIEPNVEAVVATRPDLVLLYNSASNRVAASRFRALGIPTLQLTTDRMADLDRITRLLGSILDRREVAEALITRTAQSLRAARDAAVRTTRPSIFILAWDRPPMTLGSGSFLSEILDYAGARNLFDDLAASSAPISIEAVATRDPDFVLTTTDREPAVANQAEWRAVGAVREKRFLRVQGSEFNRPSPRIAAAVRQLSDALAASGTSIPR